jgi:hypothetical protein
MDSSVHIPYAIARLNDRLREADDGRQRRDSRRVKRADRPR